MKIVIRTIGAAVVAIVVGVTSLTPAAAAPVFANPPGVTAKVELVEHRRDRRARWKKRHDRRHDRFERRQHRRGYWNGYRGYREHRRGYRRHSDGFYYRNEVFRLYIR